MRRMTLGDAFPKQPAPADSRESTKGFPPFSHHSNSLAWRADRRPSREAAARPIPQEDAEAAEGLLPIILDATRNRRHALWIIAQLADRVFTPVASQLRAPTSSAIHRAQLSRRTLFQLPSWIKGEGRL